MDNFRHHILTIFLIFVFALPLSAQNVYTWKSVVIGGGGFVSGIVYHPKARGLVYARTDMGGAYRWSCSDHQWIPLTDMFDREHADDMGILSLALDPNDANRVYMACGKYTQSWAKTGALLSSIDRGTTWTRSPLPVKIGGNEEGRGAGERLQVDPNNGSILFLGTTNDGLWKSTDHGSSWKRVISFLPVSVNFVLFDPSSSSVKKSASRIFAAVADTNGNSLYRSDDGGETWSSVPGQPHGLMGIHAVLIDTMLYATFSNYPGPNGAVAGSVMKYDIVRHRWTDISPAHGKFGFSGISCSHQNPNILTVSTLDRWDPMDEIYRSMDGGTTWSPRLSTSTLDHNYSPYTARNVKPHWIASIEIDPFDSSKAMFGTGYGIWAADNFSDSNPTWAFRNENLEEMVPMQIIFPPGGCLVSAIADYDGFRHTEFDKSPADRHNPPKWTTLSIAFAERVPSKIVKTFNTPPFGASSIDSGKTWQDFAGCPKGAVTGGKRSIAISVDAKTIVWNPDGAVPSYSMDDGTTWTACGGGVPPGSPVADRSNANKFYIDDSLHGTLWVSLNGGKTFEPGVKTLPPVRDDYDQDANIASVPGHDGDIWICCGSGGLYRSVNSSASATKIESVSAAYKLGFGKSASAGGYPTVYFCGKVGSVYGIFRSNDAGASWIRINDDLHQFGWIHQIIGDPDIYGKCYISTEGRGILYGE
jgi:photosystem II stability/assembly factor-like uncharacterized protein